MISDNQLSMATLVHQENAKIHCLSLYNLYIFQGKSETILVAQQKI